MANYLYICAKCGRYDEVSRPINSPEKAPECCDQPMKKKFSPPSINLVGGGFYRNGG